MHGKGAPSLRAGRAAHAAAARRAAHLLPPLASSAGDRGLEQLPAGPGLRGRPQPSVPAFAAGKAGRPGRRPAGPAPAGGHHAGSNAAPQHGRGCAGRPCGGTRWRCAVHAGAGQWSPPGRRDACQLAPGLPCRLAKGRRDGWNRQAPVSPRPAGGGAADGAAAGAGAAGTRRGAEGGPEGGASAA